MTSLDEPHATPVVSNTSVADISDSRHEIADGLSRLLSDTYSCISRRTATTGTSQDRCSTPCTSCSRRNTTSSRSLSTSSQYASARSALLHRGSYRGFAHYSNITEEDDRPDATEVVRRLVAGQNAVVLTAKTIFAVGERAHDEPTADLLTQRILAHEKSAWMLRSMLA